MCSKGQIILKTSLYRDFRYVDEDWAKAVAKVGDILYRNYGPGYPGLAVDLNVVRLPINHDLYRGSGSNMLKEIMGA